MQKKLNFSPQKIPPWMQFSHTLFSALNNNIAFNFEKMKIYSDTFKNLRNSLISKEY
jgi:hypothetical protein